MSQKFWRTKPLSDLSIEEWEKLCDGCGRCCVKKFEDPDTGEIYSSAIACRYLDLETCQCSDYDKRKELKPECLTLFHHLSEYLYITPPTCTYRLLLENKDLPSWHPLLTGDPFSAIKAGASVQGVVIPEDNVHPDDEENFIYT